MKKPAIMTGLKWGLFSATATLSAFFLPAFILGNINSSIKAPFGELVSVTITGIILFAALYHGLYRVKTICEDLDFNKRTIKVVNIISALLLSIGTIAILIMIIGWSI